MMMQEKNTIVDWLLTFLFIAVTGWLLIWLFAGCSCLSPKTSTRDIASANKVMSENALQVHERAQERRTQVGLINVSSEMNLREFAGVVALTLILLFVIYKLFYHWKNSPTGSFLKDD